MLWVPFALTGIALFVVRPSINARYVALENTNRFNKELSRSDLAVVFFYCSDRCNKKDKCARATITQLKNIFKDVSNVTDYRQADMNFIAINTARNECWSHDYGLDNQPQVLLFKNGTALEGARLSGSFTYSQLRSFIETSFNEDIDQAIKDRQEERRLRAQEAAALWAPYWSYYGWPYYYNGPYWGGCCGGAGIYFGTGCGY